MANDPAPRVDRSIGAAVVAGVPIDDVGFDEAIDLIGAFVMDGRASGRSFQVATVNVDFVVNASDDTSVLEILQRADLCLADGMPVVWHARLSGARLRERIAGADLVPRLVDLSRANGWRIVLFGSANGVAESAAGILRERFPGAEVFGLSGPIMADVTAMDHHWIDEVNKFDPDIVCVALGNPKQEKWIEAYRSLIDASVFIGVGGTLDFLVGGRRRAPTWMQRTGLEWIYRASQEPGRLGRRYLRDAIAFGPSLTGVMIRSLVARLGRGRKASPAVDDHVFVVSDDGADRRVVDLTGVQPGVHLVTVLVGVARDCHRAGKSLTLECCSDQVAELLTRHGLVKMFEIDDDCGHETPSVR